MPTSPDGRLKYFQCRTSVRPEPQPSLLLHFRSFTVLPSVEMLDGFSEQGSSFVPDGTRFVLARSPSDESLGYFRASLRDLGSRCLLMRSNGLVAGYRFPVEPRTTRVSRTNTGSKVPSRTTDNSQLTVSTVGCGCKDDKNHGGAKESGAPGAQPRSARGTAAFRLRGARGITQRPRDCPTRKRLKRA